MGVLHEFFKNSGFCEVPLVPAFNEKTAVIRKMVDIDDQQIPESQC